MNALSKLFETLHLSRRESASRRSHRRRRTRQQESTLSCETLESKQLLAADVAVQFSDQVLETTDPITVALEGKFEESEVSGGTIVKFETNAPLSDNDFFVELTDNTPQTNANFLSYVNNGDYDNSIFHRSVPGFALQGGGYTAPQVKADLPGSDPNPISSSDTVQNEPGNLNTRGTIAMAKLAGQPDSATSQFFFNLSDNEFLNSDNGGYTVFGEVIGSGMTVVDTMASAPTYLADAYYANTAFKELPLYNLNADNIVQPDDFVKIENVDVVTASTDLDLFTYQVTSSDAAKLTASVDGNGNLVLTPDSNATGSVDVTVTATSRLDNTTASDTFSVQLNGGGPVLTAIEEVGTASLSSEVGTNLLYANDVSIIKDLGGITVRSDQYAGWAPLAAETIDGTNFIVWVNAITKQVGKWEFDSNWQHIASTVLNNGSADYVAMEVAFAVDANGDGEQGSSREALPTDTTGTILERNTGTNVLYVGDIAVKDLGGKIVRSDQYAGWAPLAAETIDGTNFVVWVNAITKQVGKWEFDGNWQHVASTVLNNGSADYATMEVAFAVDANGDENIG